jgi:hypothetical protein|tara:strand:+ start:812 stop:1057 length:246 start_codon:yes stop_codon:yes gene_type:complete
LKVDGEHITKPKLSTFDTKDYTKKEWSVNQIFKKIYLIIFKMFAYLEIFSGKARVWALNRMHNIDYKPHKKYMRGGRQDEV